MNQNRPAGQILLRSLTPADADSSHIGNAVYEQSTVTDGFGGFPANTTANDAESADPFSGPGLTPQDGTSNTSSEVQRPQADVPLVPDVEWSTSENATAVRSWPKILLAIGCVVSALLIGLGFRSKQMVPASVRVRKSSLPVEEPGRE